MLLSITGYPTQFIKPVPTCTPFIYQSYKHYRYNVETSLLCKVEDKTMAEALDHQTPDLMSNKLTITLPLYKSSDKLCRVNCCCLFIWLPYSQAPTLIITTAQQEMGRLGMQGKEEAVSAFLLLDDKLHLIISIILPQNTTS